MGETRFDDVLEYEPRADALRVTGRVLPTARDGTGGAAWDGQRALLLGGMDARGVYLRDVVAYERGPVAPPPTTPTPAQPAPTPWPTSPPTTSAPPPAAATATPSEDDRASVPGPGATLALLACGVALWALHARRA